jgi:hypothetical protein
MGLTKGGLTKENLIKSLPLNMIIENFNQVKDY